MIGPNNGKDQELSWDDLCDETVDEELVDDVSSSEIDLPPNN